MVLTNSMANNDAAGWLGQLLLEAILDSPIKNSYLQLARDSFDVSSKLWLQMATELDQNRIPGTQARELSQYAGSYLNIIKNWHIYFFVQDNDLCMCHQDDHSQSYRLEHYHYDTFSWLLTRDETAHRGLFPMTVSDRYLLTFGQG